MPAALGFGPIKDDEDLLDRLGSRSSEATDGLEGLFASWTASIDEDEQAAAHHVGPLGLRRVEGDDAVTAPPRTRVVKVPRSRAVALVGALALTLSGGGVAAALTQAQSDLVNKVIEKATSPIVAAVPQLAAQSATPTPTVDPSSAGAALAMVQKAREAVDNGEVQRAIGMMEVIRSLAPKDSTGDQITAQVDQLEQEITGPVVVAEAPAKHTATTTAGTPSAPASSTRAPGTTTAAPAPAPTVASAPPTAPTSTTTPTADPTRPTSGTGQETPATTATTTPAVGNAGGEQNAGTATSPVNTGTKAPGTTAPGTTAPESEDSVTGAPSATTAPTGAGTSATTTSESTKTSAAQRSSASESSRAASSETATASGEDAATR